MRSSLAILFVVLIGGRIEAADGGGTLRLATYQFPVSADVKAHSGEVIADSQSKDRTGY